MDQKILILNLWMYLVTVQGKEIWLLYLFIFKQNSN